MNITEIEKRTIRRTVRRRFWISRISAVSKTVHAKNKAIAVKLAVITAPHHQAAYENESVHSLKRMVPVNEA